MVQYFDNGQIACVDDYIFRRDKKTGYYLSTKAIGKKRKRLHVYVWEKEHGEIRKGYQVHHIDHDKGNNEPDNLALLTVKEHRQIHAKEMSEEAHSRMKRNLSENAITASKAWHGSPEGLEWHRQNGIKAMRNRKPTSYKCTMCGGDFQTKHIYGKDENRFCSNKCKSAYRRKSGVDNADKICEKCGEKFIANKYAKVKYCTRCKSGFHRGRRTG